MNFKNKVIFFKDLFVKVLSNLFVKVLSNFWAGEQMRDYVIFIGSFSFFFPQRRI